MWNECQACGTNLPRVSFSLDNAIPQGVYGAVGTSSRIVGGLSRITSGGSLVARESAGGVKEQSRGSALEALWA